MPRRYLPRTGPNRLPQTLENEALDALRRQAQSILNELTRQFTSQLQDIARQAASSSAGDGGGDTSGGSGGGLDLSSARLFANAASYAFNQPRTRVSSSETGRSAETAQAFRVSRTQVLAEANARLGDGDKNR